jgi:Ran-binding protein 9/10
LFGPFFTSHDVIGCGFNLFTNEIFYTKNGRHIGVAFEDVPCVPLYPSVSMHSQGECVRMNFGQEPFRFDISAYTTEQRTAQHNLINQEELDTDMCIPLIQEYLAHAGYHDTLKAFQNCAQTDISFESESLSSHSHSDPDTKKTDVRRNDSSSLSSAAAVENSTKARQTIRKAIHAGDINAARDAIEKLRPDWLARVPQASFALDCQQVIEHVRNSQTLAAVELARDRLLRYTDPSYTATLQSVMGLLAYTDPSESPLAHILTQHRRDEVFDVINEAILVDMGCRAKSSLDVLLRQLIVVDEARTVANSNMGEPFELI